MRRLTKLSLLAYTAAFCCASAHAVTLDWTGQTWTAGTLNNSFDVDPAHTGSDVTFAISGNTSQFVSGAPAINNSLQGGFGTAPSALNLFVDFASQGQSVTVNVTFSAGYTLGVSGVSFTLFDVDGVNGGGSSFQDQVRSIIGIAPDGTTVTPTITTSATPSYAVSVDQVITGNANSNNTGTGSGDGNVTISFAGPIKSFSYVYGSGTNTTTDPTQQQISMSNLAFTPVPEVNPSWAAAFSCLAAGYLIRRHNARVGK